MNPRIRRSHAGGPRGTSSQWASAMCGVLVALCSLLVWLATPAVGETQSSAPLSVGIHTMSATDFVRSYELALATQDWGAVDPLVHHDASVTFSDGSVHKGKDAVRAAFERNFRAIVGERYRITNVHWLLQSEHAAVYLFDFHWTGTIDGHSASGAGRGTTVIVRGGGGWQLLTEHLGPAPG